MKILSDDRVLGARELEHVCLNVRVEVQWHTFANLVVNTSKNSSQVTRSVKTLGYKTFIIKIYNIYRIRCTFKYANPQTQRFGVVGPSLLS
jgi:hypothetical protein